VSVGISHGENNPTEALWHDEFHEGKTLEKIKEVGLGNIGPNIA